MNDIEPTDLVVLFNEIVDKNENLEIVASDCTKQSGSDVVAVLVTWFSFSAFFSHLKQMLRRKVFFCCFNVFY